MAISLDQVHVVCEDVGASVDFYRRVGVDIPAGAVWESGGAPHHVNVKLADGVTFELGSVELTKAYDPAWSQGAGTLVVFAVASREDVDRTHAELTAAGYRSHLAPFDAFWGARYAIVDDPDGNHVGIMSPSDDAHRGAPPVL